MKTYPVLLSSLFLWVFMSCSSSQEPVSQQKSDIPGIQFQVLSWDEALKQARESNKLIFMDLQAQWCGPCKQMERIVFSDSLVGKKFNEAFVNVKVDVDTESGGQIAQRFGVNSIPSLLFLDGEGKLLKGIIGFHSKEQLLLEAKGFLK